MRAFLKGLVYEAGVVALAALVWWAHMSDDSDERPGTEHAQSCAADPGSASSQREPSLATDLEDLRAVCLDRETAIHD